MGYYTTFKFKATLKRDLPEDVVSILKKVVTEGDLGHNKEMFHSNDVFTPEIEHPFFKCERWYMLFLSTNFDNDMPGGKFYEKGHYWVLDLHTEFKNYGSEVDHFMDWITPYIAGRKKKQFVGSWQGENDDNQTNIYINR